MEKKQNQAVFMDQPIKPHRANVMNYRPFKTQCFKSHKTN